MNKFKIILLLAVSFLSCKNETENIKMNFLTKEIPNSLPIDFKQNIVPKNKFIHKGIFSPDLQKYYYTISDINFEKFEVFVIEKIKRNGQNLKKHFLIVNIMNTE